MSANERIATAFERLASAMERVAAVLEKEAEPKFQMIGVSVCSNCGGTNDNHKVSCPQYYAGR